MLTDFLIVGGGAVGLTSAQSLLQAGYRVTLVERGLIGKEASWAGGGILSPLCPWDYREAVTRLALRSMGMFVNAVELLHDATGIDPEYQRCGMLLLPPYDLDSASSWCAQHLMSMQSVQLADYLPDIPTNQHSSAGLLLPDIAQVRNPRLLGALRKHVELLGGVILEHQEVTRFALSADRITGLETSRGKISADAVIVAAGAWSKTLLGEHALDIDIRPIRGQILLFKFDRAPFRQILLVGNHYFIPRRDGHILVGSTLEDVGFDKSTTLEARESLMASVKTLFPEWHDGLLVNQWAGFRPGSPHNIPVISRHPKLSNLYINSGHFRYGVTMALASAELLCNVIEAKTQPIPVDDYRWR